MVHILIAHSEEMPSSIYNAPAWIESDRGVLQQHRHNGQAWCKGALGKCQQTVLVLGGAFRCHNEQGIPATLHIRQYNQPRGCNDIMQATAAMPVTVV